MRQRTDQFEELHSAHELVEFLKTKGRNHTGGYFHYTNINALKGMLSNRKLHLSSGREMNDLLEPKKGSSEVWERLYVASFAIGNDENMGMWGIYGEPLADALRIKFKCKNLRDVIQKWSCSSDNSSGLYEVIDSGAGITYKSLKAKYTVEFVDVVYLSYSNGKTTLFWNEESMRERKRKFVGKLYNDASFAGCLKNVAWKYERETRILVKLKHALPNVKKVAIDINDALVDIEVLCGPCLKPDHLKGDLEPFEGGGISASQSLGQVNFQAKCKVCDSTDRCPRTKHRPQRAE